MAVVSTGATYAGEVQSHAWLKAQSPALLLSVEEQNQVGMRVGKNGEVVFFALRDGSVLLRERLPLAEGVSISALACALPEQDLYAMGLSDGTALVFEPAYQTRFQAAGKSVAAQVIFPYERAPFTLDQSGRAISFLALAENRGRLLLMASIGEQLHGFVLRSK